MKSPGSATITNRSPSQTPRKRKTTNPNKHKLNKRTKSTKFSSLFPKRGNRNTKRTEKHKNKMTHGKTYTATKSKSKSKSKSRTLSLRFTSLNVITSLNATVMSLQYGGRQQSKWLFYQIIILEMKGVPEEESLIGVRSIQKNTSLAIAVCITRQASWWSFVIKGRSGIYHKYQSFPWYILCVPCWALLICQNRLEMLCLQFDRSLHHSASLVMPDSDPWDEFFCLPLTSVIDPYSMTWKLNRKQSGQPYSIRSQR